MPDFFGDQPAPLIALASAAALTTRLRLGTMVLAVDYRHPVMLAKEAATLDLVSGGRLELGLGAGWLRREYETAGLTFDSTGTRIERLEETIRILDGPVRGGSDLVRGQALHRHGSRRPAEAGPAAAPADPDRRWPAPRPHACRAHRPTSSASSPPRSPPARWWTRRPSGWPASVAQKLAWVKEGAGSRYADIELSLIPTLVFEDERESAASS